MSFVLGLVEFLGPRLSSDELSQIWAMGDKSFHVVDNLHGVLAAAAPKLAAPQLDHLLSLVQEVCIPSFSFLFSFYFFLFLIVFPCMVFNLILNTQVDTTYLT